MKISKQDRAATIAAFKEGLKAALTTQTRKGLRTAAPPADDVGDVTDVKTKYSISKYLRGGIWKQWDGAENEERLFKALGQDDGAAGGFFVPSILSNEIIELLKDTTVIRSQPGVRVIQMETDKLEFNRTDAGPTISWGGESTTIAEDTTLEFGKSTLETHKAVCLYKMSRELLQNANISIDALVRMELADALGLEEDSVFLEGTGGTQPEGIYYNPRILSTDLSGSVGYDNIMDAEYQVRNAKSGPFSGYVMHPRTVNSLRKLKDGEGRFIYSNGGPGPAGIPSLNGIPVSQTTQIGVTSRPGASESYIVGGKWSDLLIGEKAGLRIETTNTGGDAFADDQVHMKLVKFVGSLLRHPESFVVIKGISV